METAVYFLAVNTSVLLQRSHVDYYYKYYHCSQLKECRSKGTKGRVRKDVDVAFKYDEFDIEPQGSVASPRE